ncbi:MAG: dTDP-4-dehydrorhamnose 3,5-epimerase [Candidatus Sumerlaeia bacterium]
MQIEETPLQELKIITPRVFGDERGFFYESYSEGKFREMGLPTKWVQDNHALSVKDTLRGLHFQKGDGQNKLVRCTRGSIWDVAVDIRPDSPNFGKWFGLELSAENKKMIFVPKGFAHGYLVLSDEAETQYKCSSLYDAEIETEVKWDDPDIGVEWPVEHPILSDRDKQAQSFREYAAGVGRPLD